jgi:hypothetical protein
MGCPEREGRVSKKYPADPDERLEPLVQPGEPDPVDLRQGHRHEADRLKHVIDEFEEPEVLGTPRHPGHDVTGIFERSVQGVVLRKLMKDAGDNMESGRIRVTPRVDPSPDEMEVFAFSNIFPDLVRFDEIGKVLREQPDKNLKELKLLGAEIRRIDLGDRERFSIGEHLEDVAGDDRLMGFIPIVLEEFREDLDREIPCPDYADIIQRFERISTNFKRNFSLVEFLQFPECFLRQIQYILC